MEKELYGRITVRSARDTERRVGMSSVKYHKLIRDGIPEIIFASGRECTVSVADKEEYIALLDAKLKEELAEYLESGSMEELADLTEVIRAVSRARGSSPEEVEAIRIRKAEERGAFEKRLLLTEVRDRVSKEP